MEAQVLENALAQAEQWNSSERYSLVLGGSGWHPGVLGIVASRVVERFHRPTVVLGLHEGQGKGSARSIRGFHMVEGFRRCAHLLEKFGGHEYAGGLTLQEKNLPSFVDAFEEVARDTLSADALVPFIEVDAQLNFSQIGFPLMRHLDVLKPFGIANPEPLFMSRNVEVCERKDFVKGARFRLKQEERLINGVLFDVGENCPAKSGAHIDALYRLNENTWNGNSTVELKLVDVRPTSN
jgi:single-stranded-DNA-specific exonuclease